MLGAVVDGTDVGDVKAGALKMKPPVGGTVLASVVVAIPNLNVAALAVVAAGALKTKPPVVGCADVAAAAPNLNPVSEDTMSHHLSV